jgi:hypothetical protein
MNRQTLFFILFSCLLLALAITTVDAHNSHNSHHSHHSNHRNYHTVTETSTNTVTVNVTSSACEPTPTDNLSCPPIAKKRHYHDHHNDHSDHSYNKTVTCTPTTTVCVTPTPQCIPDGQPVACNPVDVDKCCSQACNPATGLCVPFN